MTMHHDQPPAGKGCVPYLVVAAILVALIYGVVHFGGRSGSDHGARPVPTTGASPVPAAQDDPGAPAAQGGTDDDAVFLDIVSAEDPELLAVNSGPDLARVGRTACGVLDTGASVSDVYAVAVAHSLSLETMSEIMDAATVAYCPAYAQDVADYEGEDT